MRAHTLFPVAFSLALSLVAVAAPAAAQTPLVLTDPGDTGWVLTATLFVLLAVLPGFAMFHAGRVRAKNMLAMMLETGAVVAVVSVLWIVIGYSLAFSADGGDWIGSLSNAMFADTLAVREGQSIGEIVFALFQMGFAILAPVIMIGAAAERARLGWVVLFAALWTLMVYVPIARWVWGAGWLADMGVIDYAGGITVHLTAGIAGLIVALTLGRRKGWQGRGWQGKGLHGEGRQDVDFAPANPALAFAGAGLVWVGSIALAGGSALTASDLGAGSAMINTHFAAAVAALVWIALDRRKGGHVTLTGFALGAVAGLSAIAPAAGSVGPLGALCIGLTAALGCRYMLAVVRDTLAIDDALGIFAVHGVGGMAGTLLTAVFSASLFDGVGYAQGAGMLSQLGIQAIAVAAAGAWTAVVTLILGYAVSAGIAMRVSGDVEDSGLDGVGDTLRA